MPFAGNYYDLIGRQTYDRQTLEGLIDRRFVLFEFCIHEEGVLAIAGEFLGWYSNDIRFTSHCRSLTAKTLPGEVVTEQEDTVAMLPY